MYNQKYYICNQDINNWIADLSEKDNITVEAA